MHKVKLLLVPLLLTTFVLYLSFHNELWVDFWHVLNIPAVTPPFSDLDSITQSLLSKNQGYNVYLNNPFDSVHGLYNYTSIWLLIFDFLNLENIFYFRIFNFFIILIYFLILQDLLNKEKSRLLKILILIFFFSTSNFLIIERLNIEIIIFSLVYLAIVCKNDLLKVFFFLLALIGKIFPIFSIFFLINNKKNFLLTLFLSFLCLFFLKDELYLMMSNYIEYARIFAYGTASMSKAIYYYSREYNLFINDDNYLYLKSTLIFLFSIYAIFIFMLNYKFSEKQIKDQITIDETMFLSGGGIYLGTYIFSANLDLRLVFLLLTFPLVAKFKNISIKYIYIFSCIVSFNSFIFEGGNPYTLYYFVKAGFIYSLKFIIFTIICFYFGKILNNHFKIDFR
tara:strand:+ start:311 stop:1495 length:1185 start_codon:yes stop_codon:yes gene_type:complete